MNDLAYFGGEPTIPSALQPYVTIGAEEKAAVVDVMESGVLSGFFGSWRDEFFGGPRVRAFERAWCEAFGVRHSVSLNSNTSGLLAAMGAIGIGPGDEVIVPPTTMSATAIAPLFYGGIPVFADLEPDTFCLDPAAVRRAITAKTRAIVAVNLFGQPAELLGLRELADQHGLYLIEDNAQAPFATHSGRWAGTVGHIGVFSLNYHKHFHTGEGGVCTTDDDQLADRMRMIRNHGENVVEFLGRGDLTNMLGLNLRMTELSAAIGIEQLKKAPGLVKGRTQAASKLSEGLRDLKGITPPIVRGGCSHSFYIWAATFDETAVGISREMFSKALSAEGVPHSVGYVEPLYKRPAFRDRIAIGRGGWPFGGSGRAYTDGLCPVAEALYERQFIIIQTCSYELQPAEIDKVVEAFHKVYRHRQRLVAAGPRYAAE